MPNRLKPLNLFDFTGGINLRPETFQLLENELPELLNMEVDPRGGLNVRKGWECDQPDAGHRRTRGTRATVPHITAVGDRLVLVANSIDEPELRAVEQRRLHRRRPGRADANPHRCRLRLVGRPCGSPVAERQPGFTWDGYNPVQSCRRPAGSTGRTTTPTRAADRHMPCADLIAQHAGYLFVAGTNEDGVDRPNRIRWSHPNNPYGWAEDDYIDISEGGQQITAMIPYSDRLLIFKPDSGVGAVRLRRRQWELTNISRTVGCVHQQAICPQRGGRVLPVVAAGHLRLLGTGQRRPSCRCRSGPSSSST